LNNIVLIGLIALVVLFTLVNPLFMSTTNARSILRQLAAIGILSFPMALLLISNSIDLSLGAMVGLCAVVGIDVMNAWGFVPGILAFLMVGAVAGMLNGVLISYARLNPVIITLGTQILFRGLSLTISKGRSGVPPDAFLRTFRFELFGLRPEIFILAAVMILCWWVLQRSRLGRYVYAAGEDDKVAFLMGVNVRFLRFMLHTIIGLTAGLVAIVSVAKIGLSSGSLGQNLTMPVIIAILLGGIDFGGGSGRISGVIVGVLFMGVLEAGLLIIGVPEFVQRVVVGMVMILALYTSNIRRRKNRSCEPI
jgi:ribose transport system permease protein